MGVPSPDHSTGPLPASQLQFRGGVGHSCPRTEMLCAAWVRHGPEPLWAEPPLSASPVSRFPRRTHRFHRRPCRPAFVQELNHQEGRTPGLETGGAHGWQLALSWGTFPGDTSQPLWAQSREPRRPSPGASAKTVAPPTLGPPLESIHVSAHYAASQSSVFFFNAFSEHLLRASCWRHEDIEDPGTWPPGAPPTPPPCRRETGSDRNVACPHGN